MRRLWHALEDRVRNVVIFWLMCTVIYLLIGNTIGLLILEEDEAGRPVVKIAVFEYVTSMLFWPLVVVAMTCLTFVSWYKMLRHRR